MDSEISESERIRIAIETARLKHNCELKMDVAEAVIRKIRKHRSIGISYKDARNRVLNKVEFPTDRVRSGYYSVVGTIMGTNSGFAQSKRRQAGEVDAAVAKRIAS